ncbi:hypothetical protein DRW03_12660 [Corallococcus sp. H22C18031201]|nr:hypothetical protein DRW03_12660 [Corallococcus sp. H22C18031201]
MTTSPLSLATVALTLLCGGLARAEPWSGATPGTTTLPQVLQSFGAPSQRTERGGAVELTYQRKSAPPGARRVRFRFTGSERVLNSLEVLPARPMKRAAIEALYGPACDEAVADAPACFDPEPAPGRLSRLRYRARGLTVLIDRTQRVRTLEFLPAPAAALPPPEAAPVLAKEVAPAPVVPDTALASSQGLAPAVVEEAPVTPAPAPPPAAPVAASPQAQDGASDSVIRGWQGPVEESGDSAWTQRMPTKPALALGGALYQRAEVVGVRSDGATSFEPSFPTLVDLYLDATASQRVRGYMLGRLGFDPLDTRHTRPDVLLGQLWLKFDVARTLYVTAGRQEVRWGSSQVWRPTDFLQAPNPDPLSNLDLRTGVDMVKLSLPWESMAANLALIGTAEMTGTTDEDRAVRYGGAVRAEMAVGPGELIATAAFREQRRPRYGLDLSVGAGIFDFNAEVALVRDSPTRLWQRTAEGFVERELDGPKLLTSAGVSAQLVFADVYRAILRVEGFSNPLGYDDRAYLPWLNAQGDYQSLYFGRYYAMGQINIARRSRTTPTVIFTTLANLQDVSFMSRLDFQASPFDVLEIAVRAFVEVPYGAKGSEFRFEQTPSDPASSSPGLGVFRAGLSLFMRI